MFNKVLDYLRYPSTWNGIIGFLTVVGVTLSPEQTQAIVTAGVSVVSVIAIFFSDSDVEKK